MRDLTGTPSCLSHHAKRRAYVFAILFSNPFFFFFFLQAKDFGFTKVFSTTATQEETYESTMRPLVDDVFSSQNALLFAYGMTNAGKTYTVLGEDGSPGLIPQALT